MVVTIYPRNSFTFKQTNQLGSDAHWVIQNSDRQTLGSYSLWWQNTSKLNNQKVGYLGDISATNQEEFSALLRHGCAELKKQGCKLAIAPIDGNTWQRYRVVTETDNSPPFFLESPYQTLNPQVFTQEGFEVVSSYHSRRVADLQTTDRRSPRIAVRLSKLGITIRHLDIANLEQELENLYPVVHQSFQSHFLYSQISKKDFIEQYLGLEKYIIPELILIAENQTKIVGFILAIPDLLNPNQRNNARVIFKTLGILPERKYSGLGILLLEKIREKSMQMGFQEAVYALIQSGGLCDNMTRNHGELFRRYALFGKTL
ncbi:GCN5-related N-acetyltransferase [[Leptolyngbya] sp. PCC 7376]|uniref:hypothetical protein n=1 Tax=[Leptolyngbya] sp. PCC 7376 TaxID=111781 RepID=UPI00029EF4C7|nr:hypothetical protein [[Leptolyngbya] sp. PCC 7376]AFY39350.1 GCN5-related N-acetyltransferase [[Leptolyngbya] sp. PCC 7376]